MTQPTIGSNVRILGSRDFFHCQQSMSHDFKCQVEEVKHENITFQVWDLAGQARRFTSFFSGKTSEAWKICRRICVPIGLPTSRTPLAHYSSAAFQVITMLDALDDSAAGYRCDYLRG